MKIKQFLLCFGLFAFLFCSCELLFETGDGGSGAVTNPSNVLPRNFWAQNIENDSFYQVTAELLAESKNCKVWAEKGSGVSTAIATSMAKAYEDEILPKMLNTFGNSNVVYNGRTFRNTMEFADYLGDEDGKLCILFLDIKDGYKPGVNDSYVAGYFWLEDFRNLSPYSNLCDMIYIDTYPSVPGSKDSNSTLAHEMQHMMNFVTSVDKRVNGNYIYLMDLWVDEGLASAADWLITGSHPEIRWAWFNQDPSGLIQKGNNFFVWGNRENESPYAVLDDYSTAYLFFQWLRLQAGNSDIYFDIITSNNFDYRAVTTAANKYMAGKDYSDWGTLLKTWLAANYINAPSGQYGYRNDATLKGISAKTMTSGVINVSLAPGEGVYSMTNNYNMPSGRQNIRYAGLNKSGNTLSDTATFSGGALLTYNANANNESGAESGTTTGVASYDAADIGAPARSILGVSFSGPFVIGAGDMLRRNGFGEKPFFELTQPIRGITVLE
jgi:hypothetical protein